MVPASRQETARTLRGAASNAVGALAWSALALVGAVVVLALGAAAATLAIGLGAIRGIATLGGGLAVWRRRRHQPWPAVAEVDTG